MATQRPEVLGVEDIQRAAQGYILGRVSSAKVDFEKTDLTQIGTENVYIVEGTVTTGGELFERPLQRVFKMQVHGSTGKVVSMKWEASRTKD